MGNASCKQYKLSWITTYIKKKKKIIQSQQFQSLEVDQQNFKTNKKEITFRGPKLC